MKEKSRKEGREGEESEDEDEEKDGGKERVGLKVLLGRATQPNFATGLRDKSRTVLYMRFAALFWLPLRKPFLLKVPF